MYFACGRAHAISEQRQERSCTTDALPHQNNENQIFQAVPPKEHRDTRATVTQIQGVAIVVT
jgi:hypothetical protein